MIELGSDIRQIIKGYGYEWDKKYIEHITGDLNAVTLHFSGDVHSDSTQKPFICFDSEQKPFICLIIFHYPYNYLQIFNGNQKPDTYLYWVNEETEVPPDVGYAIQGHSAATTKKVSAQSNVMHIDIHLK